MASLQVEELEPRWLLNACTFSPRSPPGQPPAGGTWTAQVALRAPSEHYGGCADAAGRGEPVEAGAQGNVSLRPGPQSLNGRGPGALSEPAPAVSTPQRGTALPGAGPESAGNAETDEGTSGTPPPEPAGGSRVAMGAPAEALPPTPVEGPAPQPAPHLENPVAVVGLRVELQGAPAPQFPPGALPQREEMGPVPSGESERPQPYPPRPGPGPAVPDGKQVEGGTARPARPVLGLLTVLPPGDLSALELGMWRLLERLERMGPRQARHAGGSGLCPWIVAVTIVAAATGAAFEIVRRQLKLPAGVPAVSLTRAPGSPPDHPFAG
jgi:hypothetical protein